MAPSLCNIFLQCHPLGTYQKNKSQQAPLVGLHLNNQSYSLKVTSSLGLAHVKIPRTFGVKRCLQPIVLFFSCLLSFCYGSFLVLFFLYYPSPLSFHVLCLLSELRLERPFRAVSYQTSVEVRSKQIKVQRKSWKFSKSKNLKKSDHRSNELNLCWNLLSLKKKNIILL